MTELSEDYIYSDNIIYSTKRKINKLFSEIKNKRKNIPLKTKYKILIVILIFLPILFLISSYIKEK